MAKDRYKKTDPLITGFALIIIVFLLVVAYLFISGKI
jgi:hypothetical protein